jgi:filamentous hemagglutinin family protein
LVLLLGLCLAGLAFGNPTAPIVPIGQASFAWNGKLLNITNSPGAVVNWQAFSISNGGVTRFIQQSPASSVLNRVIGVDPSQILGKLQSNDRVILITPAGTAKPNQIVIEAKDGSVTDSPGGALTLAPGKSMTLADPKSPDIKFQVTAPKNGTLDVGQLMGVIGNKGVASVLTNRTGNANTAVIGENGNIILKSVP